MDEKAPIKKSKIEIFLGSSVATAIVTVVLGTFGSTYVLQAIQRAYADEAKAAEQRSALINKQLEALQAIHETFADYHYLVEFILYDITQRGISSGQELNGAKDYDSLAKKFIVDSEKQIFVLSLYFRGETQLQLLKDSRLQQVLLDGDLGKLIVSFKGQKEEIDKANKLLSRLRDNTSSAYQALDTLSERSYAKRFEK